MTFLFQVAAYVFALGGAAFLFRLIGRNITDNAPYFRDMSAGVAIGFAIGAFAIFWVLYTYLVNLAVGGAVTLPQTNISSFTSQSTV